MQNTLPDRPPQTFISYSRENQQFAIRLACELKSAGFFVWMDQFDIPTGARWDDAIENALRECDIFLFIITPASIASENAKDELGYGIDHGKHILPVLLETCEVPLRLRRMQYVDFTRLSFDEGIRRAIELLTKLVQEIEGAGAKSSTPVTQSPVPSANEPKTNPTRRGTVAYDLRTASRLSGNQTRTRLAAGIGAVFIVILFIAAVVFGEELFAPSPSASPVPTAAPTQTLFSTETPEPTHIPFTPTTAISSSFAEEFDSDDLWEMGWSARLRNGDPRKEENFKYAISNGNLVVDLTYRFIWVYFLYDPSIVYNHVEMEVVVDGLRSIDTLGLVCQFSDEGWYEFDIDGGGEYFVRFVDSMKANHDEARYLIDNGYVRGFHYASGMITENTIRAGCSRNHLSLSINGRELMGDFPTRFVLEQGQIGIAVRSYENYPVQVVVKSIRVTSNDE